MIADELRALAVHLWPNAILHAEILVLADRVAEVERDLIRLIDSLREGRLMWQGPDYSDQISSDPVIGWREVWIIPEPKVKP